MKQGSGSVKRGDLNNNAMKLIKIPHQDNFIVKTKEMYTLNDDEMKAIKEIADTKRKNGEPYYRYAYVIMIMINTGLTCW